MDSTHRKRWSPSLTIRKVKFWAATKCHFTAIRSRTTESTRLFLGFLWSSLWTRICAQVVLFGAGVGGMGEWDKEGEQVHPRGHFCSKGHPFRQESLHITRASWKVKRSSPRIVLFEDRRQEHSPVEVPQHLWLAHTYNCNSGRLLPSSKSLKTRAGNEDTAGTCG